MFNRKPIHYAASSLLKVFFILIITLILIFTLLCITRTYRDNNLTHETHNDNSLLLIDNQNKSVISRLVYDSTIPVYNFSDDINRIIKDDAKHTPPIRVQSIHTAATAYYEGTGIFKICTDKQEMNQGSHYSAYSIDSGAFILYENKQFADEFTVFNNKFYVNFEYTICNGRIVITHIPIEENETWRIDNMVVVDNNVLITFHCLLHDGNNLFYPMLLNVETHELTDILQNNNVDIMCASLSKPIQHARLIDPKKLIVKRVDGQFIYIDATNGIVCNLESICQNEIEDCAIVHDKIVCWDSNGNLGWINIDDSDFHPILSNSQLIFASGIWCHNGCSFIVYNTDDSRIHLYDLQSNEDIILDPIEGWKLDGDRMFPGPDGRKFFIEKTDQTGTIQILVFNCDTKTWLEIKRDNPNDVSESLVMWASDNEIVVSSLSQQDFYIYQLGHL